MRSKVDCDTPRGYNDREQMQLEKFTHYGNQKEKGKPITIHNQMFKGIIQSRIPHKEPNI